MIASSSGATAGLIVRGAGGFLFITASSVVTMFVPEKGFLPVAIS